MATVEKKSTTQRRQKKVAREFQEWCEKHPNALRHEKVRALDLISDVAFLQELDR